MHLASYPVDCYELVVRSLITRSLREALVESRERSASISRSSGRVSIAEPSTSS